MKKLAVAGAIVASVAGAALIWAGVYTTNFVKDNLAEQKISFPAAAVLTAQGRDDLVQYADAKVDTGDEAKAFSSYIQGHIAKIADGQTYSEVSGQYQALQDKTTPEAKKLEGQRLSIFMGETLRGTLLNAYGWGFVGKIATLAGIGLISAGAVLGMLVAVSYTSNAVPAKSSKKTSKKRK